MADAVEQEELFDDVVIEPDASKDEAEESAPSPEQISEVVESFDKPKEQPKTEGETEEDPNADKKGDSSVIKLLRKQNRDKDRDLRELRRKLNEQGIQKEPELGEKPTLEKCDYSSERFEHELEEWTLKKRAHDDKAAAKKREEDEAASKWQAKLSSYGNEKSAIGLDDFEEAEAVVQDLLDQTQQGIIIQGAKNRAILIYALGKNEETLKKLAAIKDPVEYAFEVARIEARLETQMREAKKRPATQPESKVFGGTKGTVDSTLERLREEAAKSGDYSKVVKYKNQKRG